jgi:hypothetical protein
VEDSLEDFHKLNAEPTAWKLHSQPELEERVGKRRGDDRGGSALNPSDFTGAKEQEEKAECNDDEAERLEKEEVDKKRGEDEDKRGPSHRAKV